jgi:hypothetical protein
LHTLILRSRRRRRLEGCALIAVLREALLLERSSA